FLNSLALDDGDLPIEGEGGEAFRPAAGQRPFDLQPIERWSRPERQHLAWIWGGQKVASAVFESRTPDAASRPCDARADRVAIAPRASQHQAEPVIRLRRRVSQQQR